MRTPYPLLFTPAQEGEEEKAVMPRELQAQCGHASWVLPPGLALPEGVAWCQSPTPVEARSSITHLVGKCTRLPLQGQGVACANASVGECARRHLSPLMCTLGDPACPTAPPPLSLSSITPQGNRAHA